MFRIHELERHESAFLYGIIKLVMQMKDQYLKAIQIEENQMHLLKEKKELLEEKNRQTRITLKSQEDKSKYLDQRIVEEEKRKEYLTHKKEYRKKFLKQAMAFGLKSMIAFLGIIIGLEFLGGEGAFSLPITLRSSVILFAIFGGVEFQYQAKEFLKLTSGYSQDIDQVLKDLYQERESSYQKEKTLSFEVLENEQFLEELKETITQIQLHIQEIDKERRKQIHQLIENLDDYVPTATFPQTDIHKLLEKK